MNVSIEESVKNWILKNLNDISFDKFVDFCRKDASAPAHNLQELRIRKNTKRIGDYFEAFTKLYFRNVRKYPNVWLLDEIPECVREQLNLSKRDLGIDLVAEDSDGNYHAIQCKYRKRLPQRKLQGVSWKELSTFYALVYRSGPYTNHIVVTNLDYVRHVGKKTVKDRSICYSSLKKLTFNDWWLMSEAKSDVLIENLGTDNEMLKSTTKSLDIKLGPLEMVREKRLLFFKKLNHKSDKIVKIEDNSPDTKKIDNKRINITNIEKLS